MITNIECDEEIAKYARTHKNVAGIWGQDSDFVIFNAAEYYFSAKHYCSEQISTVVYSSTELAKIHGLNVDSLPIVASMLANDFIQRSDVTEYHRRVTGCGVDTFPKFKAVFTAVAKFVKEKVSEHQSHMNVDEICNVLCREMLGSKQDRLVRDSVQHSLKTYFVLNVTEVKASRSYSEKLLELLKGYFCFFSHTELVLTLECMDHGAELEDLESNFEPVIFVFDPINSRFGVLRNHLRDDPNMNFIKEYAVYSENSVNTPRLFKVNFPSFKLDLLTLLPRNEDHLKLQKLKILLWMLTGVNYSDTSVADFQAILLRIDPKYHISSLVLFYLFQIEHIISELEVEVFIAMFIRLSSLNYRLPSDINPYPNYKAVHLATLFNCGIRTITRAASILDVIPSIAFCQSYYFDGILF